jgi:predicted RNA-binding Zn-ribbon protein involved in translation (DUF1610 family)
MTDDTLKSAERKIDRRSFLRGSGLVAAAALGVAAAGRVAFAQEAQQPPKQDEKKDDAQKNRDDSSSDSETKIDAEGREYRTCPQCGSNMYRQGRTWTCENCGYSYVE